MTYWQRLRHHPGLPFAVVLTVMGAVAGGIGGALIMGMFWIPVLITARDSP